MLIKSTRMWFHFGEYLVRCMPGCLKLHLAQTTIKEDWINFLEN